MLAEHIIKSVSLPPRKIYSYFSPVKDALGLRMPGVSVAGFILDKVVDLFKLESKNTTDTCS
jgi:hypothetical protein